MKKIIIVHPQSEFKYPPMGALYLCDALEKSGIYSELIPCTSSNYEFRARIEEVKPDAVGMSVITSPQIPLFVEKSKFIKDMFGIPVIWGGIHPSLNPAQCSREKYIDYVITGQAELSLPKMMESLNGIEKKIIISEPVDNLDKFSPRWDKIDIKDYVYPEEHSIHSGNHEKSSKNMFYYLMTSRGCPYKCTFCSENLSELNPKRWNAHSSSWVEREIEHIESELEKKAIKIDGLGFWDDMFWLDKIRGYKIIDLLKRKNLKYLVEARADQLLRNDSELFKKLSETGCHQVFVGAESASQDTLDYLRKGSKVEDYRKLVDMAEQFHIPVRFSFIVGFPEETDESVNKTLDFVEWINKYKTEYVSISGPKLFTPYPGTVEFDRAVKKGLKVPQNTLEWGNIHRRTYNYLEIFPWLRGNLISRTINRLDKIIGEK